MGGVAQNTEVQGINAGRMRERLPTAVVALAWWDLKTTQQPEQESREEEKRATWKKVPGNVVGKLKLML